MKKIFFLLTAMLTLSFTANAMSYEQARNEALFLTDKMAYELNLTDAQYEAAYEINLDYLMGVTSQADVYGPYWERRNLDLSYILLSWQWEAFRAASYFFRPLYWHSGYWHFGIYARYPHRDFFYFGRPHFYATYRGGHSWRMNGGHSFYEHRRSHFSTPAGRSHFGMRDGWDRGDFRNSHGHSSTRITANRGTERSGNFRGERGRLENNRSTYSTPRNNNNRYDNNRSSMNRDNSMNRNDNRSSFSGSHNSTSSFSGSRNTGSARTSGSFSGSRSSSSSFSGSRNTGSARTSGSFSGSRNSSSSFSGSRNTGSARTSGSFSGSRSVGSSARSAGGSSHSGGGHSGGHMGGRR